MQSDNETVDDIVNEMREDDVRIAASETQKTEKLAISYACDWLNGYADRLESALRRERKPKRNCDRFATAEEAYNACPQFCDIDVKTMSDRELKIVEATIRGLEWIFAPCEEGGAEGFKIAKGEVLKEGHIDDETSQMILKATVEMLAQYMSAKASGEKVRFRVPTENGPVLITVEKEIAK